MINAVDKVKKHQLKSLFFENKSNKRRYDYDFLNKRKVGFSINDGIVYYSIQDIIYAKAETSYSHVFFAGQKPIMISKNLSELEEMIKDNSFFRIHRSHLINVRHIIKYHTRDSNFVEMSDGTHIEVSRRKKEDFLEFLAQNIL
ncbi:MAG: LytTR family transcriptional regulator [Bacteroidetes bacterium]|nr:LytTR family transcriptional regulator [Bacteroidota bacterium]